MHWCVREDLLGEIIWGQGCICGVIGGSSGEVLEDLQLSLGSMKNCLLCRHQVTIHWGVWRVLGEVFGSHRGVIRGVFGGPGRHTGGISGEPGVVTWVSEK